MLLALLALSSPPPQIPPIGRIFGIRVNYDTRERLERRLGPGLPVIGGHPNGARVWRDRQKGWTIYADGFEYANGGLLLEGIRLHRDPWPKARLARRSDYGIFASIRPGMTLPQVKAALQKQVGAWKGSTFTQSGRADIPSDANSERFQSRHWIAAFKFDGKGLAQIDLRAE